VFDVLGKARLPRSLRALKRSGRYVLIGVAGEPAAIAGALLSGALAHLTGRSETG